MSIDNKKKAVIHIAKQQLAMTDVEYRAVLSRVGASSSVELTAASFTRVMAHFEKMGFKSKPGQKRTRGRFDPQSPSTKNRLMSKINAQLLDMDLGWSYADGISKRMFKIDLVEFCDAKRLQKIVAALAYRQKKQGKGQVSGVRCQVSPPLAGSSFHSDRGQGEKG